MTGIPRFRISSRIHVAVCVLVVAGRPWAIAAQTGVANLTPPAPTADTPSAPSAPSPPQVGRRPTVTLPRVQTPPSLDGSLDDVPWRNAARITQFVQQRPLEGVPATEQTDVYLAYDSQHLYVGIHARYGNPAIIRANRVDRDRIWNDDFVAVMFDPFLDQQRAYVFAVNGYGVQGDALSNNRGRRGGGGGGGSRGGGGGGRGGGGDDADGAGVGDTSWDALFSSAGRLVEDGWMAELAIPFKSLRYPTRGRDEPHRWGLQIQREISSKDEVVVWAPLSRDVMSELAQMGTLDGLVNLSTSRNIELLPTLTAIQASALDTTTRTNVVSTEPEAGLNLKYGVTSNLTLDFTYNPDFSQIESDRRQIEINQRFPLFFPELRPFFLEGQEIFRVFGPVSLVHTRTIVDPQFGAKLSGKIGRTAVGLLIANDEAPGNLDDRHDPAFGRKAQFIIGRAKYDLYRESTTSVIFTNRTFGNQHSRAVGFDGEFALGRTHRALARVVFTDHRDEAGVPRKGHFYDFNIRKEGRNLSYSLMSNAVSPDLRTDVGFVRRTDQRQTFTTVSYRWWPGNWIVNWGPRTTYMRNYQYDGTLQDEQGWASVNFNFARNVGVNASYSRGMERYNGFDFWKTRYRLNGEFNASRRFGIFAGLDKGDEIRFVENPFLGRGLNWDATFVLRPLPRLQSAISIDRSGFVDPRASLEIFDAKVMRVATTFQFTDRLLVRNIMEYNPTRELEYLTGDRTLGANLLITYRVNAGTVFYLGYDDQYRQGNRIEDELFSTRQLKRTNRAVFTKLQYLFRM